MRAVDTARAELTAGQSHTPAFDEFPSHQLDQNLRTEMHTWLANPDSAKRVEHIRMGGRFGRIAHGWRRKVSLTQANRGTPPGAPQYTPSNKSPSATETAHSSHATR